MITSYNEASRVYTCYFTREEFDNLLNLVINGVVSYHGLEHLVNMEKLRILRDELIESYVEL